MLEIDLQKADNHDAVTLTGKFDEDVGMPLSKLLTKLSPTVHIHLEGVTAINSLGVRAWTMFIRELTKRAKVTFIGCSRVFMAQVAMIPAFKSTATIESFVASVECLQCHAHSERLLSRAQSTAEGLGSCPNCAGQLVVDEVELMGLLG